MHIQTVTHTVTRSMQISSTVAPHVSTSKDIELRPTGATRENSTSQIDHTLQHESKITSLVRSYISKRESTGDIGSTTQIRSPAVDKQKIVASKNRRRRRRGRIVNNSSMISETGDRLKTQTDKTRLSRTLLHKQISYIKFSKAFPCFKTPIKLVKSIGHSHTIENHSLTNTTDLNIIATRLKQGNNAGTKDQPFAKSVGKHLGNSIAIGSNLCFRRQLSKEIANNTVRSRNNTLRSQISTQSTVELTFVNKPNLNIISKIKITNNNRVTFNITSAQVESPRYFCKISKKKSGSTGRKSIIEKPRDL